MIITTQPISKSEVFLLLVQASAIVTRAETKRMASAHIEVARVCK